MGNEIGGMCSMHGNSSLTENLMEV